MEPAPRRRIMDDLEDIEADMQHRRQAVTPASGWDYVVAIVLALGLAAGIVLLSGCVGSAQAEVALTVDPGEQAITNEYVKITKESLDALLRDHPDSRLRVMVIDDPCLAKMEKAMRAMDYWIFPPLNGTIKMTAKIQHELNAQWEQTKKDCWRLGGKP